MPGVERTAPPTPKAADNIPVSRPRTRVRVSRTRPGCTEPGLSPPAAGCAQAWDLGRPAQEPARPSSRGCGLLGLLLLRRDEARGGDRRLRPALALVGGELAQQGDGAGVVVARTADNGAVLQ